MQRFPDEFYTKVPEHYHRRILSEFSCLNVKVIAIVNSLLACIATFYATSALDTMDKGGDATGVMLLAIMAALLLAIMAINAVTLINGRMRYSDGEVYWFTVVPQSTRCTKHTFYVTWMGPSSHTSFETAVSPEIFHNTYNVKEWKFKIVRIGNLRPTVMQFGAEEEV